MSAIYTMQGSGELLEVYEDKVVITPKGVLGLLGGKGLQGAKTIPFFSISGIRLKDYGVLAGYMHFSTQGEVSKGVLDTISDENTFTFAGMMPGEKKRQNELAHKIKQYVENKIQDIHRAKSNSSNPSMSDELMKLAEMKEKGILSDAEFQAAKLRLIG